MSETHNNDEDLELVESVLASPEGDTRAFESLVNRHSRGIVANCRYITGSSSDAEELAQDVFMKAYFAMRRFRQRSKFRTWLQRIKVNHCLNHLKKSRERQFVELEESDASAHANLRTEPAVWAGIETENEREKIALALDRMTDTLRIPLILRDMDGMPYQEIADALGVKLSAIKMRIKRAREEFRERYESMGA